MDSQAARPVQQRYTAGGCALDITLQPSALSQWYPRPVAQALTFKLWFVASGEEGEEGAEQTPRLVAEGDREMLQAIAHYIAQQTRAALALAHPSHRPTLSAPCPPSLQVQSPLSYLQLCDLTAVFNQYEQAVYLLPVPLSPSAATGRPRGRLIAFPAHRRVWASSAAAALLAVGLTTALLTKEQETAVISDSSPSDSALSNAEPSPRQRAASRSEDAPTLESAPVAPEPAAENPPSATPTPSADRRPAPTPGSPKPAPNRPAPAVSPDPSAAPPPAAADAPPEEAIGQTGQTQEEALSATQATTPNSANDSADERAPALPTPFAARQPTASAPEDARAQTSAAADAALQAEALDIIAQVQSYFQARWQASDQAVQLPLAYQLQLSSTGEVISFTGLNDAAREYRDRLLPADPPTFSRSADEALTLRLTLTADGLVQVTQP